MGTICRNTKCLDLSQHICSFTLVINHSLPHRWWQPRFIHEEDWKYHKRTFWGHWFFIFTLSKFIHIYEDIWRIAFNLWLFLKQPADSWHLHICLFISFFGILCFDEAINRKLLYSISFSVWIWLVSHIWGPYQILHFVDSTSWAIVYMHLPQLEFFLLGLIELWHIELNQLP